MTWPNDLMPSKQDSVSTLGYHWTDHTGRPLEPQIHWDATGTTLADASTQWCPSGDPVLICIIGTHWKTIGKPLEDHWKHTGYQNYFSSGIPVYTGVSVPGTLDCHWIATGRPLAQGKGAATDDWRGSRIWRCGVLWLAEYIPRLLSGKSWALE